MDWDDLRYVLAVAKSGSLARAARVLGVEHTTVVRRLAVAEAALGARLFTRTTTGLVPTADADRLLGPMRNVEEAVLAVERAAQPSSNRVEGTVRITSPESFGVGYLAPRLAAFSRMHPALTIELVPAGEVLDLGRRQAEVAVRMFRSKRADLVVRRVGSFRYGLYATDEYLTRHPMKSRDALAQHTILAAPSADLESAWLRRLCPDAKPTFISSVSLALLSAARASTGIAVIPRYLGEADPTLRFIPMPDAPTEPIWLTVHQDLKSAPRVRAVLDFLGQAIRNDARLLDGA